MISYIRGELVAVEEEKAVIDVGGVGYGILCLRSLWENCRHYMKR